MRKLSKAWPPHNVSPDGQQPRSFALAKKDYLRRLQSEQDQSEFARSEFDRLDKKKLREVMYKEQGHLCVYCESPIGEGSPVPRIDHWKPLSLNPNLALEWANLYLACSSNDTCDGSKEDQPLRWHEDDPDLPWPKDFDFRRHIGFTSLGEMYIRKDVILDDAKRKALQLALADQVDGAHTRKSILNLNHDSLKAARQAALDSELELLENDFVGKHASRGERTKRASALLRLGPLPDYVSIRIAGLKHELGKGK